MKKIILSVVAIMAFGFANAQDKKDGGAGLAKGDVYLTGNFSFSNEKTGDAKSDGLTIRPGIGYMIADNLAIVGSLGFSSSKKPVEVDILGTPTMVDSKTSGFGLSAGVAYFFTPADKFSVSVGGVLSYDTAKQDALFAGSDDVKTNTIGLNVPLGLHYFVSDNFAITTQWGGLGYSSSKPDYTGADATNKLSLGLNMDSIAFGLIYKL